MTRSTTTAFNNELDGEAVAPFYAIELEFDDGFTRFWTGYGDIAFGGNTYTGSADLAGVDTAEETTEIRATGAKVIVSGVPSTFISLALTEQYQGGACRIHFGFLGIDGSVVADPYMVFEGKMDVMNIAEASSGATVTITAENQLISLGRGAVARYTDADQKIKHPGDRGLEFVNSIQNKSVTWGQPGAASTVGGGGGGFYPPYESGF